MSSGGGKKNAANKRVKSMKWLQRVERRARGPPPQLSKGPEDWGAGVLAACGSKSTPQARVPQNTGRSRPMRMPSTRPQ